LRLKQAFSSPAIEIVLLQLGYFSVRFHPLSQTGNGKACHLARMVIFMLRSIFGSAAARL
jgi:hypothetical protein